MKLTARQISAAEAKALLYGVSFDGLQEMPKNRSPKYTWTDLVTGGTFLTDTIRALPEKVRSVRKTFVNPRRKTKSSKAAAVKAAARLSKRFYGQTPRFGRSVNIKWPKAVSCLGHCAQLDYLSDKFDRELRIYSHEFDEFPEIYADPRKQPGGKTMLIIVGKFKLKPEGITG